MRARLFMSRSAFGANAFISKLCLASLLLAGVASANLQAAVIIANAQMSGVAAGRGRYNYTLTLNNTAASTASIGLFWFAWEAGGGDFLESSPTSIQTPATWSASVEGGGEMMATASSSSPLPRRWRRDHP